MRNCDTWEFFRGGAINTSLIASTIIHELISEHGSISISFDDKAPKCTMNGCRKGWKIEAGGKVLGENGRLLYELLMDIDKKRNKRRD
jgi:hypothetical protein